MKRLLPLLHSALADCCDADERPVIVKALCCELLGVDEYTYYLRDDVTLTPSQQDTLVSALRRLQHGEPLQYVLGSAPFAGLTLQVDGHVLIPRPETGQLVRLALEGTTGSRFLDVGTGSGCIALALAQAGARVTACDISGEALAVARRNAQSLAVPLHFVQADILALAASGTLPAALSGVEVDGIVSNPPYIRQCERAYMEQRVLAWEPSLALFVPDADPLLFYRALAQCGQTPLLRHGGTLSVEVNRAFAFEVSVLFQLYGYASVHIHPDLYGNDRFVTARKEGGEG